MITLDEIKNLPAKEKWLIYTALQKELDVPGEISYRNKEDELETNNNVEQEISEKEMLRYIPIILLMID
ncbi:MAG: hypothetical protein MUF24_06440 [Chitinophagaceae bacterium]|jgi:hypothetical protein|nr:hypothetical protein [Chitinophagaceae bacterium]